MAATKISALTELTAPASVDLLPIVDDPSGTPVTKRVTVANLLGNIPSAQAIGWADLLLVRDAANTLALRNGANAQAFNIYNTYTDASNYERGGIRWTSNEIVIGSEKSGTGVWRGLKLFFGNPTRGGAIYNTNIENGGLTIDGQVGNVVFQSNIEIAIGKHFRCNEDLAFNSLSFTLRGVTSGTHSLGTSTVPFKDLFLRPSASLTPDSNGDLCIEATNNTTLTFKLKGSDGTVRSGTVTLT